MSSRPIISPYQVITNGNMASATVTSTVSIIQNISMPSYAVTWTGSTPIGTLKVQASNDYSQNVDGSVRNAGTWNDLPLYLSGTTVSSIPITGNSDFGFIDIDCLGAFAIRLLYTKTSGTGTFQAYINGKVA